MTTGVAGSTIGIAGVQPVIGAFVQDTLHPNGATDFAGCNPEIAYTYNAAGADIGFTCYTNYGTTQSAKPATWGSSAVALIPGDKVTIAAGVFTKDNAAGTHTIFANVPAAGYAWAVLN